ncbi:hypothetical protein GGF50DRAFT_63773, partial [Schizophyllum commune]
VDDIKIEYHPSSGRPSVSGPINEVRRDGRPVPADASRTATPNIGADGTSTQYPERVPWAGFATALDFEVAEFTLDAQLNARQTETLVKLLRCTAECPSNFTLRKASDIDAAWENAGTKVAKVRIYYQSSTVKVEHRGYEGTYQLYHTDLWDWMWTLVTDPNLAPYFVWNAQRLYRWNGTKWVRFFDEPWTGNRFWRIQNIVQAKNGLPYCWILYADVSKMSSFASAKAYPIVLRCANIVAWIRNGEGWGGGIIVGWMPIVENDSGQAGKKGFIDFKTAVWHNCMRTLFAAIAGYMVDGRPTVCGDDIERILCLFILILAADYEEQTTMALTRGVKSNFPCPWCLVPADELWDLRKQHPMCSAVAMEAIYRQSDALFKGRKADQAEELLKSKGLRSGQDAFWYLANSDPYEALSYDTLHSAASGLFAHHIWKLVKQHIELLGRDAVAQMDYNMSSLPRWSGLNHFEAVMNITFNDGTKHADLSRQMIFAAHTVLTEEASPAGYKLLCVARWYQEIFGFLDLSVQTETTIANGRERLPRLAEADDAFIVKYGPKNWNFPKIHLLSHAFDDIEDKGATMNFSTKPFEKLHGPIRRIYLNQTNFKEYETQILKILHRHYVAQLIRDEMSHISASLADDDDADEEEKAEARAEANGRSFERRIYVGSPDSAISFSALESRELASGGDNVAAFSRFRIRLNDFLRMYQPNVALRGDDTINPYKYLRVKFLSEVDWTETEDKLRCNPSFHKKPRYDFLLLRDSEDDDPLVGQMVYMFTCKVEEVLYPLVLVRCMDAKISRVSKKDRDLGLIRVRVRPRTKNQNEFRFFSLLSVVRGLTVAPAFDRDTDYLVMNHCDEDLLLRTLSRIPPPP